MISLAQNTCLLLLESFPSGFNQPLWQHGLPGGINWVDGYEERWLLWIGWFRKYANCSRFVNFIRVNSSHWWQDEWNSKDTRGREGRLLLWMWQLDPKWMEWNDSERRRQAEVLIGVRFLGREGAEVMVQRKKKGARMRTRSILFGEDNTWHLEDTQGPKKQNNQQSSILVWNIMKKKQQHRVGIQVPTLLRWYLEKILK